MLRAATVAEKTAADAIIDSNDVVLRASAHGLKTELLFAATAAHDVTIAIDVIIDSDYAAPKV